MVHGYYCAAVDGIQAACATAMFFWAACSTWSQGREKSIRGCGPPSARKRARALTRRAGSAACRGTLAPSPGSRRLAAFFPAGVAASIVLMANRAQAKSCSGQIVLRPNRAQARHWTVGGGQPRGLDKFDLCSLYVPTIADARGYSWPAPWSRVHEASLQRLHFRGFRARDRWHARRG